MNFDDEERAEAGRRLGYDIFRFSRWAAASDWPASVREGHAHAHLRRVAREPGDRFVRKWLQLRLGALRRGRSVDAAVTPALLREIDVSHCPVTRAALTHGECQGSDWSVDRLNNDGAYAANNLAVMSARANRAKGDRCYAHVIALSEKVETTDGLAPVEWLRLAGLMLGPCFVERIRQVPLIPLLAPIPPRSVRPGVQLIQHAFATRATRAARAAGKNALVKQLRSVAASERAQRALHVLAEAVHAGLKRVVCPHDVWLQPQAMAALAAWRQRLDDVQWALAGALAGDLVGARRVPADLLAGWQLRAGSHAAPLRLESAA